jgi:16S rRNA (adenine1518-N6/adenine1519-N6)-dimethyltransferase
VEADALDWLRNHPKDWTDWKLVSNLPYACASPLLVELAQAERCPNLMTATVQLEVAQRLAAGHDTEDYGLLTVLVQRAYQPGDFFRVPAGCFYPEPNVDSACITLHRRPKPLVSAAATADYVAIAKRAFSQRRKMMAKLLKEDWPADQLSRSLAQAQVDPAQRAESVSPEQFARLTEALRS